MLQHLTIKNYALIRHLNIDFSEGFSVLTGETGAGKSIILGALGLIIGNRADTQVLLNADIKCVIEGTFRLKNYGLKNYFKKHDLDYEEQSILRREINASGKSRAFINDTPVNLNVMKELADRLVNIHSQHKTITLNDSNFQLAVLDDFVKHDKQMEEYRQVYMHFREIEKQLKQRLQSEDKMRADEDYLRFQFEELEKADLRPGEQEELEAELDVLQNAEEIKSGLEHSISILNDEQAGVNKQLAELENGLKRIARYHKGLDEVSSRISSNLIDLKDILNELENIEQNIHFDNERVEQLQERLDNIYHLQQKHRLSSIEELIKLKDDFDLQLNSISSLDEEIGKLQKSKKELTEKLKNLSGEISANRREAISEFEKNIENILHELGMPDARFRIDHSILENFGKDGIDKIRFLFNANKGVQLNEISRIASGGELSRLMLSIKSLISGKSLLPTIIFDEIDMGVSGEIANKVGKILEQMSDRMQVLAITHLPQIAARGKTHYLVYKETDENSTVSLIKKISGEERIQEIAKMLSGEKVSEVAIQNAKELILHNN
ncbi:MAG: DNA repair protein RecN [Bacteroidota bacterium]|nr:DNA repair protein RecN [Bacteroidota bacterium]